MTQWSTWLPPGADAVTAATPLGMVKDAAKAGAELPFAFDGATAIQFFVGRTNGCIGEVCAAGLILGGIYMLWRRCISWHIPVAYIGKVAVIAAGLWLSCGERYMPPHFHLLAGGLMLGAIFMATDMVTSPVTKKGMLIYGIGCGVLTMVVRLVKTGAYPEGVSFAILLMNAATPLINRATKPRVFGTKRGKGKDA
jgi:electron transport complex protein RnfD